MVELNEIAYISVLLFPFLGSALVPVVGRISDKGRDWFAVVMAAITAIFAIYLTLTSTVITEIDNERSFPYVPNLVVFGISLDALSLMMALIASVIGSLIVLYSVGYMAHDHSKTRYYSLVMLFIGGMLGLVLTDNFLILLFFWEVIGLCSYALIGHNTFDEKAARAGMKAFVTTRIGDFGLFIGIFLIYWDLTSAGATSTQAFSIPYALEHVDDLEHLGLIGFMFLLAAIGKSAQFPLHVWLPDAMEAPTTISALIHAATLVNSGIYLLIRTFPLFHEAEIDIFGTMLPWTTAVAAIGVTTAFLGASMALMADDLKRMLAYSTVSQLGLMMFGIGVGGILAASFHMMNHAVFKALLFLSAGAIIHEVGTRDMREMGGLKEYMPYTRWAYLIGALALAGIPLIFNGYYSKDLIFVAAEESGNYLGLAIAIFASMITFAYSLKSYWMIFEGENLTQNKDSESKNTKKTKGKKEDKEENKEKVEHKKHIHEAPAVMVAPLYALAIGSFVSILFFGFLYIGLDTTVFTEERGGHELVLAFHELADAEEPFEATIMMIEHIVSSGTGWLITLAIVGVGGVGFYAWKSGATRPYANSSIVKLLENGYYIDHFYMGIVKRFAKGSANAKHWIEEYVVDEGLNYGTAEGMYDLGLVARKTQTGDLNYNMVGITLGILFVVGLILLVLGVSF